MPRGNYTIQRSCEECGKIFTPQHWCRSIVALLVPRGRIRKDKSQKRKKQYAKHWLDEYHPARGI